MIARNGCLQRIRSGRILRRVRPGHPAKRITVIAVAFALIWTIAAPSFAFAWLVAERCCADHCQKPRTAQMDRDCCRVENASASAPFKAAPSLAPMIGFTSAAPAVAEQSPTALIPSPVIAFLTAPPPYLEYRSLRL